MGRPKFLSTPSARRATPCYSYFFVAIGGISIHALREEGDQLSHWLRSQGIISIHALREEGDSWSASRASMSTYFYPRPPRGGRPAALMLRLTALEFLSTPSARRATIYQKIMGVKIMNFYPRPPRGGRPFPVYVPTLLEKSFLSTPSARRATRPFLKRSYISPISIHALREEGDVNNVSVFCGIVDFYPRPPRGGRQSC